MFFICNGEFTESFSCDEHGMTQSCWLSYTSSLFTTGLFN